jgi:hypothetical protein
VLEKAILEGISALVFAGCWDVRRECVVGGACSSRVGVARGSEVGVADEGVAGKMNVVWEAG